MGLFNRNKYKSLSRAVLAGDLHAARRMLDQGANPEAGRDYSTNPLFLAAQYDHEDVVRLLLDAGAELGETGEGAHDFYVMAVTHRVLARGFEEKGGVQKALENYQLAGEHFWQASIEYVELAAEYKRKAFWKAVADVAVSSLNQMSMQISGVPAPTHPGYEWGTASYDRLKELA